MLPPDVARDVDTALEAVTRVGTGRRVRVPGFGVVGKTGTTEEHRDAWFVGAAGGYVTAVWVGYPDNRKMTNVRGIRVTGSSFPAQIWMRTMAKLLEKGAAKTEGKVKKPLPRSAPTRSAEPSVEPSAPPSEPPRPRLPIPLPSLP